MQKHRRPAPPANHLFNTTHPMKTILIGLILIAASVALFLSGAHWAELSDTFPEKSGAKDYYGATAFFAAGLTAFLAELVRVEAFTGGLLTGTGHCSGIARGPS